MDVKEKFNSLSEKAKETIKSLFTTEEPKEQKFEAVNLADGSVIEVEPALEIGAVAAVMGEDGSPIPLEDGDYELETGDLIVIQGGVIADVLAKQEEAPAEDPEAEEMAEGETVEEKTEREAKKVIERTEIERMFAEQKETFQGELDKLTEELGKQNELLEAFGEVAKILVEEPKEEATQKTENKFKKSKKASKLEAFLRAKNKNK